MGRFSAGGARLHEPRQPKPANAALRQGRPPLSHGSSLGPEHPQSAIRPACREGPTLDVDVVEPPPVPPAQRWPDPPRRPRGALPALLPLGPHRPHARSSAAGLLPGTRRCAPHARHPHRIPGDIGPSPAIRWGCRPSRAFANPALRAASRAYRQTSRARRPCIGGRSGNQGKSPRSVAGPCGGFEEEAGPRACRTPAAALVQKAPKTALGRAAAPTQAHQAQCGTGEAPQERRRGCTRTPRRRRRSGWTRP